LKKHGVVELELGVCDDFIGAIRIAQVALDQSCNWLGFAIIGRDTADKCGFGACLIDVCDLEGAIGVGVDAAWRVGEGLTGLGFGVNKECLA